MQKFEEKKLNSPYPEVSLCLSGFNPCPAEPVYTLPLQTV